VTTWPAADEMALEKLQAAWGSAYIVKAEGDGFHAEYRYGEGIVRAGTLAGLDSAIRAHWSRTWSAGVSAETGTAPWDGR
jgi:hypothetical protein